MGRSGYGKDRSGESHGKSKQHRAETQRAERVKAASRFLRGTIIESLADRVTGAVTEDAQLLKFHGTYQQDDRDLRDERAAAARAGLRVHGPRSGPGGHGHAGQWLALDDLAGPMPTAGCD